MTTITTVDARVTIQDNGLLFLELTSGNKSLVMTAFQGTPLFELAELIINQEMPGDVDRTFQKRYTVEWHIEDVEGDQVRIVDDVQEEQLPDEAARDGYTNLPGWATWTADEAEAWIEVNVVDLGSAKDALKQMARALTYLRDWRRQAS
jgi:hypothetical protein